MIIYIGLFAFLLLVIFSLFSSSYKKPFIASILFSPIIASTWKFQFSGISLIDLYFVLFVLIFIIRILIKKECLYVVPYQKLFLIYVFVLIFVSLNIYARGGILTAVEFLSKSLYLPLCFYWSSIYFSKRKDAKTLIISFILAVIFPLLFIFIQKATGYTWRYHETRGLVRSQGVYHDVVSARIFIIQALLGSYLYWHYFLNAVRSLIIKYLLVFLSSLCVIGLYFLYSKAIVVTLILWILLFAFLKKRIYILPLALGLFFLINSILGNRLLSDMRILFSKEIEYAAGNISSDYVLAGRGGIWKMYSKEWKDLPILEKMIGTGRSHGFFHNDFLRVLFSGGLLLLILYGGLIIFFSVKLFKSFKSEGKIIHFAALLGISYYLAESLGQLPGFYPIIQPVTWGLVGLSLNQDSNWTEKQARG